MDSLSQIVLGAGVAGLSAPPAFRRRALLWGSCLGTLPDLDVLVRYTDPVEAMVAHRSWSHSLFVLPLLGTLLWGAWLYLWPVARAHAWRWFAATQLALVTHPLLDAFTVYGTQLFWPLASPPVMLGSVFIIDPLYTLPLLAAMALAWRWGAQTRASKALAWGLCFSSGYLAAGLLAQWHIQQCVLRDLHSERTQVAHILVTPAPFTALLWRVLVVYPNGDYAEGHYSYLAPSIPMRWQRHSGRRELLQPLQDHPQAATLRWFTHDFFAMEDRSGKIVFTDLRMGSLNRYPFRFALGQRCAHGICAIPAQRMPWPRYERGDWQRWYALLRGAPAGQHG